SLARLQREIPTSSDSVGENIDIMKFPMKLVEDLRRSQLPVRKANEENCGTINAVSQRMRKRTLTWDARLKSQKELGLAGI
ncbi:MAG: hypothetical protein L6R42_006367, partial [Xanthoria sp. 1 TBL-2021]